MTYRHKTQKYENTSETKTYSPSTHRQACYEQTGCYTKQLHDELGLAPGDRIEFARRGNKLILTPQALVEKHLAEGLDDLRKGRVSPIFRNVEEFKHYLKNR